MKFQALICFFLIIALNVNVISFETNNNYDFATSSVLKKIDKDVFEISFEVKKFCDVTISIKDHKSGETIRHLASGVLGKNAPEPFEKNSKSQKIIWNGKDDNGILVFDYTNVIVEISLGLHAKFEKTLYWSPYKRSKAPKYRSYAPLIYATPDGIYVFDGESTESIRLFDSDGNYIRTSFPFSHTSLKNNTGMVFKVFPQDHQNLPRKSGKYFNNLLTTAFNDTKSWSISDSSNPQSIVVHENKIILAQSSLNIIETKNKNISMIDTQVWQPVILSTMHEYKGGTEKLSPSSLAISSNGDELYMTGYLYQRSWHKGGLNGVLKLNLKTNEKPSIFAGKMINTKVENTANEFDLASCVFVDQDDNILVGDYGNNRIQVYRPNGKHIKNINVNYPSSIHINPKNKEIYVLSSVLPYGGTSASNQFMDRVKPSLTILKSLDDPTEIAKVELPISKVVLNGPSTRASIDFWGPRPRLWISDPGTTATWIPSKEESANIKIYDIKKNKLELIKDFHQELKKEGRFTRGPKHMKQRLYFDYKNKSLIVGEIFDPTAIHCTSIVDITNIDILSGQEKICRLPFDAEDMAIDQNGLAYLRTKDQIARFDAKTWKEIPFDYGVEMENVSTHGFGKTNVISGLTFKSDFESSSQLGGMSVSPKGHVVVTSFHLSPEKNKDIKLYPGRSGHWQIKVWNKHGKILYNDAVAGIGRPVGINMDKNDDLYLMVAGRSKVGQDLYYHPISCTYIKTKPNSKFFNTESNIPLTKEDKPNREPEIYNADYAGDIWTDGASWILGGVGFDGKRNHCHCASQSRPGLDYFGRSFLPEVDRYSILVVDTNGNQILRFGRYGNVDDGLPIIKGGGPPNPNSIGGDEIALMHCQTLAIQSNDRVFLSDLGNARILSIKLLYQKTNTLKITE